MHCSRVFTGQEQVSNPMQIEVLGGLIPATRTHRSWWMATIYRGYDMHEDRVVAIKVLRESL